MDYTSRIDHRGRLTPIIKLKREDEDEAFKIGAVRYNNNPGIMGSLLDTVMGIKGEIAFGFLIGKPIDLALYPKGWGAGDKGIDFMYRGMPIDIKTRGIKKGAAFFKSPDLLVETKKLRLGVVYVLAQYSSGYIRFWGWAHGSEVGLAKIKELKKVDYVYPNWSLYDMDDLLEEQEKQYERV